MRLARIKPVKKEAERITYFQSGKTCIHTMLAVEASAWCVRECPHSGGSVSYNGVRCLHPGNTDEA
jgi:hypothetical protein